MGFADEPIREITIEPLKETEPAPEPKREPAPEPVPVEPEKAPIPGAWWR